jgi:hypothetical protein
MTGLPLSLQPAAAHPVVGIAASGAPELIDLGNRLWLSLDNYRLRERFDSLIHGEDMIKFHVRLSGRRSLTFDGFDMLALDDMATAVLLHERDLPKTDHILADHDEMSVTVGMSRTRFLEYLDAGSTTVPVVLEDVISRYAYSPRLATAVPTPDEIRLAREILGCRRTGPRAIQMSASIRANSKASANRKRSKPNIAASDTTSGWRPQRAWGCARR